MAYSVIKKDGKIKDFIQGVKNKRNIRKTEALTGVEEEKKFKGHSAGYYRKAERQSARKNKPGLASTIKDLKFTNPFQTDAGGKGQESKNIAKASKGRGAGNVCTQAKMLAGGLR